MIRVVVDYIEDQVYETCYFYTETKDQAEDLCNTLQENCTNVRGFYIDEVKVNGD